MIEEGSDEQALLFREYYALKKSIKGTAETASKLMFTEKCQQEALQVIKQALARADERGRMLTKRIEVLENLLQIKA